MCLLPVYPNVFHKCGGVPIVPADAGVSTEPPVLTVKTDRTHCEYCQAPLDPTVYHKCAGNEEYKPAVQQ